MNDFTLKILSATDMETELKNIGYDKSYAFKAKDKFSYINLKIFSITPPQGNIIKQLALAVGADCGTHRDVIVGKIEKSDCILGGNLSQLSLIAKKLQLQPFGLKQLGILLEKQIDRESTATKKKTKLVGILNLTQDSFSDGGKYYNFDDSIKHLHELINDGADIIDIGAESTKPFSQGVTPQEQLNKLIPVLDYIKTNNINIPISIDTRSSQVIKECIQYGISIVNDVSGLDYDKNMADVLSQNADLKVVIQHSKGTPDNMQSNPTYNNLMDEIVLDLFKKTEYALSKGIKSDNIIVDPGIGFGKTMAHNFEILKRHKELNTLGFPVMIGLSRKSLLNMPQALNEEKDIYTLALNSILINDGVDYIRVHNVGLHKKLIDMLNQN